LHLFILVALHRPPSVFEFVIILALRRSLRSPYCLVLDRSFYLINSIWIHSVPCSTKQFYAAMIKIIPFIV